MLHGLRARLVIVVVIGFVIILWAACFWVKEIEDFGRWRSTSYWLIMNNIFLTQLQRNLGLFSYNVIVSIVVTKGKLFFHYCNDLKLKYVTGCWANGASMSQHSNVTCSWWEWTTNSSWNVQEATKKNAKVQPNLSNTQECVNVLAQQYYC